MFLKFRDYEYASRFLFKVLDTENDGTISIAGDVIVVKLIATHSPLYEI